MSKILAHIYTFFSLLMIMITYDAQSVKFLYDYGMIGTKEGRIMRKVFRK